MPGFTTIPLITGILNSYTPTAVGIIALMLVVVAPVIEEASYSVPDVDPATVTMTRTALADPCTIKVSVVTATEDLTPLTFK